MSDMLESCTDLLIIGAGPAGLMAAAWASRQGISARIIDKSSSRVPNGHADGLQPRTLEIFDSFSFVEGPLKEGFHEIEICSWNPDSTGKIQRTQRVVSQKPGISRYQQTILNQGSIEQTLIDFLAVDGRLEVERNVSPEKLEWEQCHPSEQTAHPVAVTVRHADGGPTGQSSRDIDAKWTGKDLPKNRIEKIKAKYVVGCDGAHSWTRNQLGLSLEGQVTDHVWGVMDILPLTNFPDIRQSCAIHSVSSGSIMMVPRERKLVRFYIQMDDLSSSRTHDRPRVDPESMLKAAQTIMAPYTLRFKYCEWWSAYQIGQRVAPKFSVDERIFLAGDAVHTHSPKLGQGLNVSMQDTYNLGWKLCGVINGTLKPDILKTYHTERHKIALELLAADHESSEFYSNDHISREDFQAHREKLYEFLTGVSVQYPPSALIADTSARMSHRSSNGDTVLTSPINGITREPDKGPSSSDKATNIHPGRRIPSFKVINQANARPTHVASLLPSTGQWRILLCAGNVSKPSQLERIRTLGSIFAAPTSFLHRYPPKVIEIITIHSAPRASVELLDLPEVFHPWDEDEGWDYEKVYADDRSWHEGFADAYGAYGIDREEGCIVICRPDQHVGLICGIDNLNAVEQYFRGILVPKEVDTKERLSASGQSVGEDAGRTEVQLGNISTVKSRL